MDHDPATYGDRIADIYDEWFAVPHNEEDAASFLSELAGSGPALELGIGTGRSPSRWPGAGSRSMALTLRRPCWRSCGRSRGASR